MRDHIDLKSAFDSVHWSALWLAFQGLGTHDIVLNILLDLHTGIGVSVRVGPAIFDCFKTTSGVTKGVSLPLPFSVMPLTGSWTI